MDVEEGFLEIPILISEGWPSRLGQSDAVFDGEHVRVFGSTGSLRDLQPFDVQFDWFKSSKPFASSDQKSQGGDLTQRMELPDVTPPSLRGAAAPRDACVGYPDEVWESHKDEIQRLYIAENRTLAEVMKAMTAKNFRATQKVYKTRFARWGWVKNNRRKDVEKMLYEKRRRAAAGKETEFLKNDRPVQLEKYLRRAKPRKPTSESVETRRLPVSLRCCTPPQKLPASPSERFQQVVIGRLRTMLRSHLAAANGPLRYNPAIYEKSRVRTALYDICEGVIMTNGGVVQGHKLVRRGFQSVHNIFNQHSLYAIIDLLLYLYLNPFNLIFAHLCQYLRTYSVDVLHKHHPLHEILEQLDQVYRTTPGLASDVLQETVGLLLGQLRQLGAEREHVISGLLCYAAAVESNNSVGQSGLSGFVQHLATTLRAMPAVKDKSYLQWQHNLLYVVSACYGSSSKPAFELASEIMAEIGERNQKNNFLYNRCQHRQAMHYKSKWEEVRDVYDPRLGLSISLLRDCTISQSQLETDDSTLYWIETLEEWEREAGLIDEADQTRVRRIRYLQNIADIPEVDLEEPDRAQFLPKCLSEID